MNVNSPELLSAVLNAFDVPARVLDSSRNIVASNSAAGAIASDAAPTGTCDLGDGLTIADCHLVPQFYAAQRCAVDCSAFPRLVESVRNAMAEEPVRRAHPDYQPDADPV